MQTSETARESRAWQRAIPMNDDDRAEILGRMGELGRERSPVLKAIRAKAVDCCAGSPAEVRRCHIATCELWPFRLGSDPWRSPRELTDEQRAALAKGNAAAGE